MFVMGKRVGGRQCIFAGLPVYRSDVAICLLFLQKLLAIKYQRHGGGDVAMAPAVSFILAVTQQHVEPSSRQIVAQQAVFEIDSNAVVVRARYPATFN